MQQHHNQKRHRGFTLIEILVVVSILAILGALIVPKIMDRPNEARVVAAKQDIQSIVGALKLYKLDNGRYPSQAQGLQALIEKPSGDPTPANWKRGGYLERLPKDPWGGDYLYLNPGLHGDIDVMSYGADGQAGGEEYDADIGNWAP
ncbi:MAG: type II secretion system protein GspG [Candidatus Dactylopiibacterium carminicum]|uniref:Type II secretion system core protein G n=1 Tax=Candidatus Dactylopiibacterium carminicum TaxID=857335 RepID=A0A272ES42_9RHOO|nr:type II secretion system major pseudopilin GspG [Candidatus Dactylopiibacterium carminicum]KAF7598702.1 type II secretion system protein GspG [Candidatus Dactylopiibacterium carminicum]PAS92520.1 MAG: type II secretion system protein GspG [Candidatus Dactylopiibacterium carminicum]PAS96316.1 MAG: type II secretion system protein GspG [Candidatus Dactylopiibacterium carminicum]PAS98569.1 MAG: type II secretion system protein GspG [Candidatus Dactylopiibacterium carminicum]